MTELSLSDKKNVAAAEKAYNALTKDQLTFLSEDEHAKMQANSERMQTLIEGETPHQGGGKGHQVAPRGHEDQGHGQQEAESSAREPDEQG